MARTSARRTLGALAVAVATAGAVAAPIALVGAGTWDGPSVDQLDLGASGAEAADGTWRVAAVDGTPVPDGDPIVVRIDTVLAELRADAGCAPLLGSFTLRPDGAASFTVPSTADTGRRCPTDVADRDAAVRAALDGATGWQVQDGRLSLTGPTGRLELTPT